MKIKTNFLVFDDDISPQLKTMLYYTVLCSLGNAAVTIICSVHVTTIPWPGGSVPEILLTGKIIS